MTLSDRIQLLIDKNNISQSELEKVLGFGKGTITKWKGKTAPSADKLQKIAEHFGVTIDYLMTGKEVPEIRDDMQSEKQKRLMEYAQMFWDMGYDSDELKALIVLAKKIAKED